MSVDIIKIDDEYFCDSPLLFYLLVQQKKTENCSPCDYKHTKNHLQY